MKRLSYFAALGILGVCTFSSLGYTYRQFECREEVIVVMIKAPDSERLVPVAVSTCSLPEQWGGQKAAVPDSYFSESVNKPSKIE